MKIIQVQPHTDRRVIGRMSDGSDRQVLEIITWHVEVEQDERVFALTFDYEPTEQEIADALVQGKGQEIVDPQLLSQQLAQTRERLKAAEDAILALLFPPM